MLSDPVGDVAVMGNKNEKKQHQHGTRSDPKND
jgi:hypothetical protein